MKFSEELPSLPTTNWLSVISLYLLSDKASDMKDTYSEDSLLGKGKNVEINYANTYYILGW